MRFTSQVNQLHFHIFNTKPLGYRVKIDVRVGALGYDMGQLNKELYSYPQGVPTIPLAPIN